MWAFDFMKMLFLGAAIAFFAGLLIDTLDEFASCAGYDYGKSVQRVLLILRISLFLLALVLFVVL